MKRSQMKIFLLFISLFIFSGYVQAETILLKSGEVVEAMIIEREDDSIKVDMGGVARSSEMVHEFCTPSLGHLTKS